MDLVNKALPEHLSTQIEESLKYGVEQGVAYGQVWLDEKVAHIYLPLTVSRLQQFILMQTQLIF